MVTCIIPYLCVVVLISGTECDDSQRHKKNMWKLAPPILRRESTRGLFFFHFTTMRMICRGCWHYGWSPRGHKIRGQNRPSLEHSTICMTLLLPIHYLCYLHNDTLTLFYLMVMSLRVVRMKNVDNYWILLVNFWSKQGDISSGKTAHFKLSN